MAAKKIKKTEDIVKILCDSVQNVLQLSTNTDIKYSPMTQKISNTSLRPDIGCFIQLDGGFSGLVVLNFPADSAIEIYRAYRLCMGQDEKKLAKSHTSEDVADTLGELMNQAIGGFRKNLKRELLVTVNQSQPKMLVINSELLISINAHIDRPQCRKVSFETGHHSPFYLEIAMEKTEFVELYEYEKEEEFDPEVVMITEKNRLKKH
ncbi:MAG: DUF3334 family protein [Desulfobacterales bacterium]|nr:DUF3334 family protein [Desulfobacterales bacterium]MCP4158576.1 DUF3334 family protein [Deltaproteobacteria bacterium]